MRSSWKWNILAGHWAITLEDCVQVCEYENWTLEVFAVVSRLYDKFHCPVARQNISFLATAHDCETGLYLKWI